MKLNSVIPNQPEYILTLKWIKLNFPINPGCVMKVKDRQTLAPLTFHWTFTTHNGWSSFTKLLHQKGSNGQGVMRLRLSGPARGRVQIQDPTSSRPAHCQLRWGPRAGRLLAWTERKTYDLKLFLLITLFTHHSWSTWCAMPCPLPSSPHWSKLCHCIEGIWGLLCCQCSLCPPGTKALQNIRQCISLTELYCM